MQATFFRTLCFIDDTKIGHVNNAQCHFLGNDDDPVDLGYVISCLIWHAKTDAESI